MAELHRGKSVYGDGKQQRDVVGYGASMPDPKWPGGAKVALQIVLNYEEGGENCLLHGDGESEKLLSEIVGAAAVVGGRAANMESLYDYGSRSGFWRLHRLLTLKGVPTTCYGVGMAMERNPEAVKAMHASGWEMASHGYRWIDYQNVDEATEREHIARTVKVHETMLGERPVGLYQGKPNVNTRRLCVEEGGFLYDSDAYDDDLPHWNTEHGRPHLVIPYTLSENDMRFATPNGFSHGKDFASHLIDSLDYLVKEAKRNARDGAGAKGSMMSVGLHCRLVGRPGRAAGLEAFLDHAKALEASGDVWICRRDAIAKHWYTHHWPEGAGPRPKHPLLDSP